MNSNAGPLGRLPWFRIGAESVAIVLSILLAFAIDAWWDYRQDRADEISILSELEAEYAAFSETIARRIGFYGAVVARLEWLLNEAPTLEEPPLDRLDDALGAVVGAPTFDFSSEVTDGLVATGRLAMIRSPELRRHLSRWERVSREATDDEDVVRDYLRATVVPFLASRGVPIGRAFATWREGSWGLERAGEAEARTAYRALVRDPEFRTLATWRYDWALSSADDARDLLEEVEAILRLVREARGG
jgi:hypothetical protein